MSSANLSLQCAPCKKSLQACQKRYSDTHLDHCFLLIDGIICRFLRAEKFTMPAKSPVRPFSLTMVERILLTLVPLPHCRACETSYALHLVS